MSARATAAGAHWLWAALVVAAVLALDQATKALVRGSIATGAKDTVVPGVLDLVHVRNEGVAFSVLSGSGALVIVLTLVALVLLVGYFARHPGRPLLWLPTGLLVGGAFGNLLDRLTSGAVTDFVKFPHWPAFNVADMAITVGVIVLVLVIERATRRGADGARPA